VGPRPHTELSLRIALPYDTLPGGDLSVQVNWKAGDEPGTLGVAFNSTNRENEGSGRIDGISEVTRDGLLVDAFSR
jgi:hypothetical protein